MPHTAENVGLAGWVLLNHLFVELEKEHPGIKSRTVEMAKAGLKADGGPNVPNVLAILNEL